MTARSTRHSCSRTAARVAAAALIAGGLAGCVIPMDDAPDNFRVFNETDQSIEVTTRDLAASETAYQAVEPGDSELVLVTPSCPSALVVREPGGEEIDRIETDAVCESSDIHYYGDGRIEVDP